MKTLHLKREDALAQAAKREDHHFDKKAKEISPQKVTRHVVAFANADGGTLVVGIADEKNEPNLCKRWDGFDSPEGANGFVQAVNELSPRVPVQYELLTSDFKGYVLRITVKASTRVHATADRKIYVRLGAQSLRVKDRDKIIELHFRRGLPNVENLLILTANNVREGDHSINISSDFPTGHQPLLRHIREGYFRKRGEIFENLVRTFRDWLSSVIQEMVESVPKRIPVFWIAGRSGEGKSVLLLQLLANYLISEESVPVLQLASGENLPKLLDELRSLTIGVSPLIVAVDHLFYLSDSYKWEEAIRDVYETRQIPEVAIVTSGPTGQLDQWKPRRLFKINDFKVPKLDSTERLAFRKWFAERTKSTPKITGRDDDNRLLVEFMFELVRGEDLSDFARRFRMHLSNLGAFEAIRTVVAINALDMDAPWELLGESSEAVESLCAHEQLHLEKTGNSPQTRGVRLAHPQLTWDFFLNWADLNLTSLSRFWARQLAPALLAFERRTGEEVSRFLSNVQNTGRLSDEDPQPLQRDKAYRRELLEELYQLHLTNHDGRPSAQSLARWLEMALKIPQVVLDPDPVSFAFDALSNESIASMLHGSVAGWVWLIAESRSGPQAQQLRDRAEAFFRKYSHNRGVGQALVRVMRQSIDQKLAEQATMQWLENNQNNSEAYCVIAQLLATNLQLSRVKYLATGWLDKNGKHPQANQVIAALLAADKKDDQIKQLAIKWLTENEKHSHVHDVIKALAAASPKDPEVKRRIGHWLKKNEKYRHTQEVIKSLLAANRNDPGIKQLATDWLTRNREHPQAHEVLSPLLAANRNDADIRQFATRWLEQNESRPNAYHVMKSLLAANPEDARQIATRWLTRNPEHPQAQEVIKPLVAANPNDADVRKLAIDWLGQNEDHPQAHEVIRTLVRANPEDDLVKQRAVEWFVRNQRSRQAHEMIRMLLTTYPKDGQVKHLATKWLAENKKHRHAHKVIIALRATRRSQKR
jgi:hypothetical protein